MLHSARNRTQILWKRKQLGSFRVFPFFLLRVGLLLPPRSQYPRPICIVSQPRVQPGNLPRLISLTTKTYRLFRFGFNEISRVDSSCAWVTEIAILMHLCCVWRAEPIVTYDRELTEEKNPGRHPLNMLWETRIILQGGLRRDPYWSQEEFPHLFLWFWY